MNLSARLLLLFVALLSLGGCSSSGDNEKVPDEPAIVLYQKAQDALNSGNFQNAITTLEALDSRYPFGPQALQVQLDLIYAYYKEGDTAKALANIDRFLRLNPTHPDVDYVYYMRGLTNMAADYNFFQSLVGIERFDRDPTYARQAFRDFATLLRRYPDSVYAADAQARMRYLKQQLARYEVAVAQYYVKRQAFVAAANRGKYVLENFADTPAAEQALEVMVTAYGQLGLEELKQNAEQVLANNFPDNPMVR